LLQVHRKRLQKKAAEVNGGKQVFIRKNNWSARTAQANTAKGSNVALTQPQDGRRGHAQT
jgi:hypothetical protein